MLTLNHLTKIYADGTQALSRVSFSVRAGEIVAVVGGSGCGKTTMLRLIAGLDHVSDGHVRIDDTLVTEPHPAIGSVFQEPRLLPWLSIADNVGFGLQHLPRRERRSRIDHALTQVHLSDHGARWPRELSGGQQQRASIARALVAAPKALLLDEPFSALDAFTRASLHDEILNIWDKDRTTILMVTHDVEEAVFLSDRVIVMQPNPGRVFAKIDINLSRPRDRLSPELQDARRAVIAALDASLSHAHPARDTSRSEPLPA
jgi:sulfonate transport system ATP-binding protein